MNIILIDRGIDTVDSILKNTDWNIVICVVGDEIQKKRYEDNDRILKIYTFQELLEIYDVECIDYEELKKYKHIQPVSESGFRRIYDDYQLNRYDFYTGVSFWLHIFEENVIDLCLIVGLLHGFRCDYILQEIAKQKNIKCFNLMSATYKKRAIYDANNGELLPKIVRKESNVDMNVNINYLNSFNYDYGYVNNPNLLKKLIYKMGGMILIRIFYLIKSRKISFELHYRKYNFFEYLWSYFKAIYVYRYLKKKYCKIDYSEKYVIYFLHFEPEATIPGYADVMDSQLVVIKMLSEALPQGWNLYIKEHPDTYKLNTAAYEYQLPSIANYKSRYFYKKILNLENVKLVDHKLLGIDLIKNSNGIATMIGTVVIEAVKYKKPVLIFSSQKSVFKYCSDFFKINSMKDCKLAMNKIANGFSPTYEDFDVMVDKYLFEESNRGYSDIILTIFNAVEGSN